MPSKVASGTDPVLPKTARLSATSVASPHLMRNAVTVADQPRSDNNSEHADTDFLKGLAWEKPAGAAILSLATEGDITAFAKAWQTTRGPSQEIKLSSAADCGERALWSQAAFPEESDLAETIADAAGLIPRGRAKQKRRPVNKTPQTWSHRVAPIISLLTQTESRDSAQQPLALLVALQLLSESGRKLNPRQWWDLWSGTLSRAFALLGRPVPDDVSDVPADVRVVCEGELPFMAGVLFSGVAGSSEWVRQGKSLLARELSARTDTDGTPHAEILDRLPLWLASLVRATIVARRYDVKLWSKSQEETLQSLVERAIPLCRPDGLAALSNGLALEPIPVLTTAAELFDLPELEPVSNYLQSVKRLAAGQAPRRTKNDGVLTMPSNQSDWARFALLRSDWGHDADSVAITHHRPWPQIDVTATGVPLIHGDWGLTLQIGDAQIEMAEEWSCVCWQSDPDADYVELQMVGPGKLRVERLVMLSRRDRFILLSDCVSGVTKSGTGGGRIHLRSTLPLGTGITAKTDTQTREITLSAKGLSARVFPLAVAQDRVLNSPHEMKVTDGQLVLNQVSDGQGLFAPIIIDWHPDRARGAAQWRSLTVTEDGKVVAPDVAAGHRLKTGNLHVLVYRSLKPADEARAVLGYHSHNETVIARVDKRGDVDPILMVEAE